jgi:hypothetical protein
MTLTTAAPQRGSGFAALRYRDFQLIAAGNMVSQLGTWMQYVGLGWVARGLTSQPIVIALVFAAQWLGSTGARSCSSAIWR